MILLAASLLWPFHGGGKCKPTPLKSVGEHDSIQNTLVWQKSSSFLQLKSTCFDKQTNLWSRCTEIHRPLKVISLYWCPTDSFCSSHASTRTAPEQTDSTELPSCSPYPAATSCWPAQPGAGTAFYPTMTCPSDSLSEAQKAGYHARMSVCACILVHYGVIT